MVEAEQVLASTSFRVARRRRLAVLVPGALVTLWSLADLLSARSRRGGLGSFLLVLWTIAFVVAPLGASVKRRPFRAGAIAAMCAGPVLTPAMFGAGGWHAWQITIFAIACLIALTPDRTS